MTAQQMYDRREAFAEISGNDLHDLFGIICGNPSPAGRTEIDAAAISAAAADYRTTYAAHKANGGVGGAYLLDIAQFAERFV